MVPFMFEDKTDLKMYGEEVRGFGRREGDETRADV
jgi:hypothetical protein